MTDSDTILVARNLSMKFTGTNGGLPALDRVSLSVRSQEFVCVVGPSGCGKTTLLRLLSGLLMPTDGRVDFAGRWHAARNAVVLARHKLALADLRHGLAVDEEDAVLLADTLHAVREAGVGAQGCFNIAR